MFLLPFAQVGGPKDLSNMETWLVKATQGNSSEQRSEHLTSRVKVSARTHGAKHKIWRSRSEEQWLHMVPSPLIPTSVCPSNSPQRCPQIVFLRQTSGLSLSPENKNPSVVPHRPRRGTQTLHNMNPNVLFKAFSHLSPIHSWHLRSLMWLESQQQPGDSWGVWALGASSLPGTASSSFHPR